MGEYNRPLSIPSHIDRYSMPTDDLNGTLCARLRWLYSFLYCRTAPLPGWLSLSLLYYSTALINFPSSLSLLCILYIYPLSRCWVSFLMRAHMFTQWPYTRSIHHLFFFLFDSLARRPRLVYCVAMYRLLLVLLATSHRHIPDCASCPS